ncbi:hypothetical protein CDD80_4547 [Ophiocordyceps camponoti-rufipedis]|uniref:FAM86 N-terminal domain-containing protein n=1 Tax=Ophiocordyceps camponoti-rufipedis TaxID=2004952 RepID=A0A2C5YZG9_9HYPO|nr:hypothetical protein CDD80_4547 [Ophiocordyceps camponoti-rufipedis]
MQHVDRFCHQYLQLQPQLDYPPDETLKLVEAQDAIYVRLFAQHVVPKGPPDRFRAKTLKELVPRIEAAIDDWDEHAVSDQLMAALCAVLGAPLPAEAVSAQERCRVRHHVSSLRRHDGMERWDEPAVTLLESPWLVSAAGTTGLRTWEAALHLGQYLCLHRGLVAGKRVLELGAGTGYVSILCAKHLSCAHAVATDGSDEVVSKLAENFALNHVDPSRLMAMKLQWGGEDDEAEDDEVQTPGSYDVVLAADVIYDTRAVPALVATISHLVEARAGTEAYISATRRNERTLEVFADACHRSGVDVEDVGFPVRPRTQQRGPFYSDRVAIGLYRLSRRPRAS